MAPSLLDRALGGVADNKDAPRRQSGGGRSSPYARPAGDKWSHDKFGSDDAAPPASSSPAGGAKGSLASRLGVSGGSGGKGEEGRRSAKLVIRNLHYEVSERELELLFVQIGPIAAGPKIKFDRSGRSEGVAWVTYGSEDHAAQAKEAFNGAPAKGQPIEVEYDYSLNRASERGAPAAGSLLARLGSDNPRGPKFASSPSSSSSSRPPRGRGERGVGSDRGARGAARGGRGGARGGREKREPKTETDLDAELEAFMKAPPAEGGAKPTEGAPPALAPPAATGGDVEMS